MILKKLFNIILFYQEIPFLYTESKKILFEIQIFSKEMKALPRLNNSFEAELWK
jgi:hypothetical protein